MNACFSHITLRVKDINESLQFYCEALGLKEAGRVSDSRKRVTHIHLTQYSPNAGNFLTLVYFWEPEDYGAAKNLDHIAFTVENIDEICHKIERSGFKCVRSSRDRFSAMTHSPDNICIYLIQKTVDAS